MERITRDYRRAVDFDSFEVEENPHRMDPDQRLIERQRGLNTEQIRQIAVVRVTAANIEGYREFGACAICLNDFGMRDKTKRMPMCQHVFHEKCIDCWLRRARECPLCKRSALAEEGLAPPE